MSLGETDAIINLGGGLDPHGTLTDRNYQRLDTSIDLFRQGVAPNLIATGGWSFLTEQPDRTEAEQMKDYAISEGVPEDAIFTESTSHDSIGNAVYTKRQLLVPNRWNRLTIVTSESHLERGVRIFERVLGEGYDIQGVPAPENQGLKEKIWEPLGVLLLAYVIYGTEKGDDAAIEQRLIEKVPGYGGKVTSKQLAVASLKSFLMHPSSVRF